MNSFLLSLLSVFFVYQTQVVDLVLADRLLKASTLVRIKQVRPAVDGKPAKGVVGCSGTYVGPNLVLTAAHCFGDGNTKILNIWTRGYKERAKNAKLVSINTELDLALLEVSTGTVHSFVRVARKVPHVGEQVISVGSPFSLEFLLSEGIVAAPYFKSKRLDGQYLIHTGMINPGSSGGGAFNAMGELIGVNTMVIGGFFGWAGISVAVEQSIVSEFLRNYKAR